MPTINQLEQRLQRINAKLTGTAPGVPAAVRQLKKDRRRLQRKLRAQRPVPTPASKAPASAAAQVSAEPSPPANEAPASAAPPPPSLTSSDEPTEP